MPIRADPATAGPAPPGALRGAREARGRGGLGRYIARRLVAAAGLVLVSLTFNFILIHEAPGSPIELLAGESATASYYALLKAKFGLNRPLPDQYLRYLWGVLHGQLGVSYVYNAPVLRVVASHAVATLLLMGTSLLLAVTGGTVLGVLAAQRAGGRGDGLISLGTLIGASVPAFWVGQLLIIVFAAKLGWFPVEGMHSPLGDSGFLPWVGDVGWHLVLPVVSLSLFGLSLVARLTRGAMIDSLSQDYVRAAVARGLSRRSVVYHHALRNALLPVLTIVGTQLGTLFGGAVVVETIFAWPGLGQLLYNSILTRDYPVVLGMFVVISVMVVLLNLATDLGYAVLDPRISYR